MKITVSFLRSCLKQFDKEEISFSRFAELLNEKASEQQPVIINLSDELPPLMEFVPVIDELGNIHYWRRTEHGWNLRDGISDNTPDTERKMVAWIKMPNKKL
jgi:hypothetical protein